MECFNCCKKEHKKADCRTKGRGKEGQGPRLRDRKGKGADTRNGNREMEKGLANVAGSEDGVWVAGLDDSGDEGMADNEFDDFMDIGDDFEEDYKEEEVLNLTENLKNFSTSQLSCPNTMSQTTLMIC